MAMQLDRIIAVSRLPNVHISVVPLSTPMPEVPSSSFVLYDRRLAIIEIPHAEITTRDPRDIEVYLAKFHRFESLGVADDGMRGMVAHIRDDFLQERENE